MIALSAITVLALLNGFKAAPVTDSCVGHFDTISWGQNEGDSDYRRRIEADQAYFLEQGLCETTSTQAKPLKKRGGEDATSSAPVDETDVCPVFTHAPDVYEPAVFVPHTVMYQVMPPLAFKYGTGDVVKGVGLGGWLITEPFMTPSLYTVPGVVDEYTLCQHYGDKAAFRKLSAHWAKFITKIDIQNIAAAGLNHIRIPVGYWALIESPNDPYVPGSAYWLHQAIGWAGESGLKVLIEIHGVPGSQNGNDNSGRRGASEWHKNPDNIARTMKVLEILTLEYTKTAYYGIVTAIQVLDGPDGQGESIIDNVKQYYLNGYQIVRNRNSSAPSSILYVLSDAFESSAVWKDFMLPSIHEYVAINKNLYSIFSNEGIAMNDDERVQFYCSQREDLAKLNRWHWSFVGEFTAAPTDCAMSLPGLVYGADYTLAGRGSRYDGTYDNSGSNGICAHKTGNHQIFTQDYKNSLRRFFEVQTSVAEEVSGGWIYWSWKTESADDWSYEKGMEGGWISKTNPSEKTLGQQCSPFHAAAEAAPSAEVASSAEVAPSAEVASSAEPPLVQTTGLPSAEVESIVGNVGLSASASTPDENIGL